jgi:hypothetical protein
MQQFRTRIEVGGPRNSLHLLLRERRRIRLTQPDEQLRGLRGFIEHRELGGCIYVQRNFSAVVDDPRAFCLFLKLGGHELPAFAASACRVQESISHSGSSRKAAAARSTSPCATFAAVPRCLAPVRGRPPITQPGGLALLPRRSLKGETGHSMTSPARARIDGGIVRPSVLAVLRLTTKLDRSLRKAGHEDHSSSL